MYKAVIRFREVADAKHIYEIGDEYPRDGYAPAEGRIEQLLSGNNKVGYPVIEEASGEATGKPLGQMNKAELLAKALELGINAPDGATNKEIVALIEAAFETKE